MFNQDVLALMLFQNQLYQHRDEFLQDLWSIKTHHEPGNNLDSLCTDCYILLIHCEKWFLIILTNFVTKTHFLKLII